MQISAAGEHPIQPPLESVDHPDYYAWVKYRAESANGLTQALPFAAWLSTVEIERQRAAGQLSYQIINAHERGEAYWSYSRAEHAQNRTPVVFEEWLIKC